jgi:hypothetical protein
MYSNNKMPSLSEKDLERIWKNTAYIKVFISHRDNVKQIVSNIKKEFELFGISSFVAHEDIEPTEEWVKEILRALQSMDLFIVFISEDFFLSKWTNQEIGFAIGRDIPIIPIKYNTNKNPEGFISIIQAEKYHNENFALAFISLLMNSDNIGINIKNTISNNIVGILRLEFPQIRHNFLFNMLVLKFFSYQKNVLIIYQLFQMDIN